MVNCLMWFQHHGGCSSTLRTIAVSLVLGGILGGTLGTHFPSMFMITMTAFSGAILIGISLMNLFTLNPENALAMLIFITTTTVFTVTGIIVQRKLGAEKQVDCKESEDYQRV
jgi:hypothetical protein